MDLSDHYNSLYHNSIEQIKAGNERVDKLIDSPSDTRFGITLLFRPSDEIKSNIQRFLDEMKLIEPNQYYYPSTDLHITVMSIISCYDGFELKNISIDDYTHLVEKSLKQIKPFQISFKGITGSSSGIMIQGFLKDNMMDSIRQQLRVNFKNSKLEQSMDKRYVIQGAHVTAIRFRTKLSRTEAFLQEIEKYRSYNFGTCAKNELELVCNDWYQRDKCVTRLADFAL